MPLEDVQFLLKHARELFPNEVPEDTRDVFSQMVQLRDRLAAERAEALQSLLKALRNMYHDVDTPRIQALLDEACFVCAVNYSMLCVGAQLGRSITGDYVVLQVATRFQKTEQIRKLTSDATNYFPVEFDMCDAQSVRRTFIQQRRALAGY